MSTREGGPGDRPGDRPDNRSDDRPDDRPDHRSDRAAGGGNGGRNDGRADGDGAAQLADELAGRRRLKVVAAVLALQVVGLLGVVVYEIVNLVAGSEATTSTGSTVMVTLYFVIVALLLGLVTRGVLRARGWSRAPVLLIELIALLGVGVPMLQGDLWYRFALGLPIVVGSAAAIVLVLTPAVGRVLNDR